MKKITLGILGTGRLATIIADAWKNGLLEEYELVGVAGRNPETAAKMSETYGCPGFTHVEELLALHPDYIAEAASVGAVKEYALKAIAAGSNLVVLSIGAFADRDFYQLVSDAAREKGVRVHIASGAVGGFDILRTMMLMGEATASIDAFKAPFRFEGTPLNREGLRETSESVRVFEGNTREAIAMLPTQVNVAVATALASTGPENTAMTITAVPGFVGDEHKITCRVEGVRTTVDIYVSDGSLPAWSTVAVLKNLVSPIVF